jgi:hypothetical protein
MDNTLEEKPRIHGKDHKPKEAGVMEQALAQLDGAVQLDYQPESWWSILVFWIRELRWRRIFWKKMGHPPGSEINK